MAQPAVRRTSASGTDQSIGDLVSVAARDISQLVRYELDLAKMELKSDVKRLAIGGALLAVGGFVCCLVLVMLCFAFALGLYTIGVWLWLSFIYAAAACVLVTAVAALIGITMVRRMNGMSKTRRSLADGISVLRRRKPAGAGPRVTPASSAKTQARAG
jgi:uncharacterized membrane protein YqjE